MAWSSLGKTTAAPGDNALSRREKPCGLSHGNPFPNVIPLDTCPLPRFSPTLSPRPCLVPYARVVVIHRSKAASTTTTLVMKTKDIWQWLGPLAHSWGGEERLREQLPVLAWPSTSLGSLARPLYVDQGVLHLAVESHVVASELNLVKERILSRLGEVTSESTVVDLRFHVRFKGSPLAKVGVPPPTPAELGAARKALPEGIPRSIGDACARALAWARARDEALLARGGWPCPGCGLVLAEEKATCPECGIERPARTR